MILRKATAKDVSGVAAVLKVSYNIDSIDEGKEAFLLELSKGINYIIAVEDDRIIGLTTWLMHGLPKHGLAELDRIAVLPAVRGKGVSKELFDALIADAKKFYASKGKKFRKLYLLTHASNERAHKFYEKLGMRHETTLQKHYYDNEDEWVYSIFI
jgi:[ribosomal protein S18]-alanine N-acetyltransferase